MTVNVLTASDLHLELCPGPEGYPGLDVERADLVMLAGDVAEGTRGLTWAAELAEHSRTPVVYVAGNHEYWHRSLPGTLRRLRTRAAWLRATGIPVWFLEREAAVIQTPAAPVRVLGATLWSDFALFGEGSARDAAMAAARERMPDYHMIRTGPRALWRCLEPRDTLEICEATVRWIWDVAVHPFDGPTVIVTHNGPTERSLKEEFATHALSPVFLSDFEELMDFAHVSLWAHGHVHHSLDYRVGGTRVVCNPRGYWPDRVNPDFDPGFVVTIS